MKTQTLPKTSKSLGACFAVAVFLSLALLAGCSSTHKSADKTLEEDDFKLTYKDKAQTSGDTAELTLQHPLPISEKQMFFHMVALTYEPLSLLGKATPVFTKEDIQKTKRLLTKALNKAHSQNIIAFEVESEEGATKGELFSSKGNLHWRFFKIRGVDYSLTRNKMARYGVAWQMVPKKGQKLHVSAKLLGTKQWTNWIEAKIDLPAPENLKTARPKSDGLNSRGQSKPVPQTSSPKTVAPERNTASLEEKLKLLKRLHKEQLIDQQEYEKRQKDLLDQYLR
jgi:hypothetical protein